MLWEGNSETKFYKSLLTANIWFTTLRHAIGERVHKTYDHIFTKSVFILIY